MPYDVDARHQQWSTLTPAQIRQYPGADARGCSHSANCYRLWDNRHGVGAKWARDRLIKE